MAGEIEALGYVGLEVSDLAARRHFAGNLLGLQVVDRADGGIDLWRIRLNDESRRVLTHDTNSAWGHAFRRPPRPAKTRG